MTAETYHILLKSYQAKKFLKPSVILLGTSKNLESNFKTLCKAIKQGDQSHTEIKLYRDTTKLP